MCFEQLIACSDAELANIDPVVQNLLVAKGIPALADLDISRYQRLVDYWAADIARRMPVWEEEFHATPNDWRNDIHFFRLGLLCYYTDKVLGIGYKEDQKYAKTVYYTDPGDLFLNGVIDTRQGTCGNMAALHLAIGWRFGWPVSLAVAWCHQFLRFDNSEVVWNIETSLTGEGFSAPPDSHYLKHYPIAPEHVRSGSDLTFLKPRQVLGVFVKNRARHWWDLDEMEKARDDSRLALTLYPQYRSAQMMAFNADCYAKVAWKPPPSLTTAEKMKFANTTMVVMVHGN